MKMGINLLSVVCRPQVHKVTNQWQKMKETRRRTKRVLKKYRSESCIVSYRTLPDLTLP
jgi:hypothetical protein